MRKVIDSKDYQRIQDLGQGFIYNDFSPSGSQADENILHRASCPWLKKSNLSVDKYYFNSLSEAERWLKDHRGDDWRKCRTCLVSGG